MKGESLWKAFKRSGGESECYLNYFLKYSEGTVMPLVFYSMTSTSRQEMF